MPELFVANPYARDLTFLDSQTRTRRDPESFGHGPQFEAIAHRWRPSLNHSR
jgi:hypothetical protein